VIALRAGNASEWTGPTGTNTYLLPGTTPTLVDAGTGQAAHLDALGDALQGAALALVLITHGHPDHASGAAAIAARWPSVRVRGAAHDRFGDQERVDAGDSVLIALHTPGHAPDHFCFFDQERGDVYCGDLLRMGGTIVIPASKGGDLQQYLASLQRLRELRPRRLLPGHGPAIDDPVAVIDSYVAHRAARERQILDAIAAGCTTPEAIVPRVYGALPPLLVAAAADSVLAHLVKLRREGRLGPDVA
jgi:hydroxyacylglutathione hydrolase